RQNRDHLPAWPDRSTARPVSRTMVHGRASPPPEPTGSPSPMGQLAVMPTAVGLDIVLRVDPGGCRKGIDKASLLNATSSGCRRRTLSEPRNALGHFENDPG